MVFIHRWYDGFSTFYIGGDGLVYRHVADKVRNNIKMQDLGVLRILTNKTNKLHGL
jgi:hypothetical protein